MVREIYYVDEARIDNSLDQLDPKKAGKVKWPGFELKIPWPIEVKLSSGIDRREPNQFRKIEAMT